MNSEILMGLFRAVIPGAVAALTSFGIGTDTQDTVIATAVATGLVAAWSFYSKNQTAMIKAVNTTDNGVTVVSSAAAASAGVPTVTAPLK
jgi:hypothetical protein